MKNATNKMMVRLSPMAMDTMMYCVLTVQDEYDSGSFPHDRACWLENKLLYEAQPEVTGWILAFDKNELYSLFAVYIACLFVFYDTKLLDFADVESLLESSVDVMCDVAQLLAIGKEQ